MERLRLTLKIVALFFLILSSLYSNDSNTLLFSNISKLELELNKSIINNKNMQSDSLSFRAKLFWGENGLFRKNNTIPDIRSDMKIRRNMLQWHQRLGLITLGAIAYQFISGKKQYKNNFEDFSSERQKRHKVLGYTTYGLYLSTASLSLLAPPSRRKYKGLSSTKIHKYLAFIHFSAMIAQPWLGYKAANSKNPNDYDRLIKLHNFAGTIISVSFSLAFITTLFP